MRRPLSPELPSGWRLLIPVSIIHNPLAWERMCYERLTVEVWLAIVVVEGAFYFCLFGAWKNN